MQAFIDPYLIGLVFSPIIAAIAAVVVYVKYYFGADGIRRSALVYAGAALAAGIAGALVGTVVAATAISVFPPCSPPEPYCDAVPVIGGIVMGAPIGFYLGFATYLYLWAKKGAAP